MANPNGRLGASFERAVADLFATVFPFADRRVKTGAKDKGDIGGVPGWVFECKNEKSIRLAAYMDEATIECENAGADWYAAIVKRRGKNVAQAYAVMPLWQLIELLRTFQSVQSAQSDTLDQ